MQNFKWANDNAESALIGCMLTDKESVEYCVSMLNPDDFYALEYQMIFSTIKSLWDKHMPVDLITVSAEGHDMSRLAGFMNSAIPAGHRNIAKIVKTLSTKRKGAKAAKEVIEGLASKVFDEPEEVVKYITNHLDLTLPRIEEAPEDMATLTDETISHLEKLATGKIEPISYGLYDLDRGTGGLWQSELTLIAAGPATGKTALALDIASHAAGEGHYVLFISREMSRIQVTSRLMTQTRLVRGDDLKKPKFLFESKPKELAEAARRTSRLPLFVDKKTATIQQIRNKCERMKEKGILGLVVIDYLQLLRSSQKHESRRNEVEYISRGLKEMALDLEIPVIALSQLTREGQKNTRPRLYDLRETGALEQDADNVIFLYNPKPDETISASIVDLEVIIAKQRNGRTGIVYMRFDKECMKFYGLER